MRAWSFPPLQRAFVMYFYVIMAVHYEYLQLTVSNPSRFCRPLFPLCCVVWAMKSPVILPFGCIPGQMLHCLRRGEAWPINNLCSGRLIVGISASDALNIWNSKFIIIGTQRTAARLVRALTWGVLPIELLLTGIKARGSLWGATAMLLSQHFQICDTVSCLCLWFPKLSRGFRSSGTVRGSMAEKVERALKGPCWAGTKELCQP